MYDFQAIQEAIVKYRILEIRFNQGQASRRAGDEWYRKARYYGAKAGVDIPDKPLIVGFLEIEENRIAARFAIKAAIVVSVVLLAVVLYL